jgi:hypothetical protein
MRIAVMQPYIFPYLGYFQLIAAVDKFILLDDVQYINKGWINRNRLLMNQRITPFTIPLKKASQNKLIKDLEISRDIAWQARLLKTIKLAYAKSAYFEAVFPIINNLFSGSETHISKLVHNSLSFVMAYLGIETELVATSVSYANGQLRAQQKILDICLQEQADEYVNPVSGADLYDKALFDQTGVRLLLLEPTLAPYPQFSSNYVPGLSILDVLMHNSPAQISKMLLQYRLV